MPAKLGASGVEEIIELKLDQEQYEVLRKSSESIRKAISADRSVIKFDVQTKCNNVPCADRSRTIFDMQMNIKGYIYVQTEYKNILDAIINI